MEQNKSYLILLTTLTILTSLSYKSIAAQPSYNVLSFGAKGDGRTDSKNALLAAWTRACASPGPATIYVPRGTFFIGQKVLFLGEKCKSRAITIRIDGILLAPSDYKVLGSGANWIVFQRVSGVTILGGTLDAQGSGLWDCKNSGKGCPTGATSLEFSNSNNILVSGLTSLNSQMFHMVIFSCNNVRLEGLKISAAGTSPNTDGIHVSSSSAVSIFNTKISTGDDCISIGPGTNNLWIENIVCGPGHGISIGSLGRDSQEPGVRNVTVKTVAFTGTQNGVRIKTWGKPSTSFVDHIVFQHISMVNVQNPVIIDQNYCPNKGCPNQASGVRVNDVTYLDIHGTSATEVAVKFDCSKRYPCSGIKLQDVNLSFKNQHAQAQCVNADGTASGIIQPSSCL